MFYSVILEDTYKYNSDLNWTVYTDSSEYEDDSDYDYVDSWEDLTGSDQHRAFTLCDNSNRVHWLRTKFIKLPENYRELEVTIAVEYAFPDCSQMGKL